MGWFGKLTFGSLGLLLAGPLGAIAGAALGHHLVDKRIDFAAQTIKTTPEPMPALIVPSQLRHTHYCGPTCYLGYAESYHYHSRLIDRCAQQSLVNALYFMYWWATCIQTIN